MTSEKTYLGDGVYAELDRGMIRLTTSNGLHETNEIFLEPEVYAALVSWYRRTMGAQPAYGPAYGGPPPPQTDKP